jgi:hypothetical protein
LTTDGEAIILNQAFEESVILAFVNALIDYLKLGPSTTSIHQANDVASTFKDMKKGIVTITKSPTKLISNPTLHMKLSLSFEDLKKDFVMVDISSAYKEKIIQGVLKIIHLMKAGYVTGEKMIRGFIDCGQHVADAVRGEARTVDYDKIMSKCMQDISSEHALELKSHIGDVGKEFLDKGCVSTEFLDKLGVVSDPPDAPIRNNLVLCNHNTR